MNITQIQVAAFHHAMGLTVGETVAIRDPELRIRLIEEEAQETVDAIRNGDLVEAIDGLCDLIYVAYGAAVSFGIDLEAFQTEVHNSNMTKVGAARREDGKILKGPNFRPPRIAKLLEVEKLTKEFYHRIKELMAAE